MIYNISQVVSTLNTRKQFSQNLRKNKIPLYDAAFATLENYKLAPHYSHTS
ncbi:hypothetical protein HanIR_Chr01g0039111 [Helianthus annuus]|nr:hypothetical protein HanIR_Chr01g0039111 [Helianthus annuus]